MIIHSSEKTAPVSNLALLRSSALALAMLLVAGCVTPEDRPGMAPVAAVAPADGAVEKESAPDEPEVDPLPEPRILQEGNDQMVAMPPARPPVYLQGEAVSLDFEQTPLIEVIHAVLGDILGLDYVVEHPIKGQVTLRTRSPIRRHELLPIIESLLRSNGAFMVRDPNDRYFVSGSQDISTALPSVSNPDSGGAGYSNVIIPLQYIGAAEMADILRPVAGPGAFVRIDPTRNLLVLAGTRNQVNGWMQMISTFDIDQLQGMSVGVFPLEYSAVEIIEVALREVLGTAVPGQSAAAGGGGGGGGGEVVTGGGSTTDSGGAGASSSLGSLVRILPLQGLDSILVISPRAQYLRQVGEWIGKLDQPQDASGEPSLYVYPVQNGNATQMAELLQGLLGGNGGSLGGGRNSGIAPGLTQASTGGNAAGGRGGARAGGQAGGQARGTGAGGSMQFSVGDNVRVIADAYNNSLLVYAPRREYRKIEAALRQLDVVPKQVLIEASILEVQLIDDLQYGIEWAFNDSIDNLVGSGLLQLGENAIGPRAPGFSYTLTDSANAVRAVVNALADESLVNVISTPSIMVLDNHTASIQVGDQQPIQSGQTISNGGNVITSIEYKDTGVQLEVTPTVNAGGLVTMDISQSVTDVGAVDAATGQRSFLNRDVISRVAVRSGESVVLGGLIRDNSTSGNSGIPFLKDIPGVGALFGGTTQSNNRTELLVFITPRVVRDAQDLRDISAEMRDRMKGIKFFGDLPMQAQP